MNRLEQKNHANILNPVIDCVEYVTKKATLTLPMGGSNITPIPKVEVPLEDTDFRGINVTHVIARAFKRVIF